MGVRIVSFFFLMSKKESQPNRIVLTLSGFAYSELKRLSEGKQKPMGTLAAIEIERWIDSPAFASLIKRLPGEKGGDGSKG